VLLTLPLAKAERRRGDSLTYPLRSFSCLGRTHLWEFGLPASRKVCERRLHGEKGNINGNKAVRADITNYASFLQYSANSSHAHSPTGAGEGSSRASSCRTGRRVAASARMCSPTPWDREGETRYFSSVERNTRWKGCRGGRRKQNGNVFVPP
jgi:hypothetical protein